MIGFPEPGTRQKATVIQCVSNQRQIALAFIMWKDDHDGKFPWQVSETTHGTMESSEKGDVAPNYSVLLAYVHQPYIFVCPTDPARTVGGRIKPMYWIKMPVTLSGWTPTLQMRRQVF